MWGPGVGGRTGAGAAGSARTWLALRLWRPDSGQGGGVRPRAERKPPGPAGREVGRVPACWGPGARGWGGPSGCGGLACGGGRHEAGPRLVLVPAASLPPLLCRETFGTHSRGPRPHFYSEERFVLPHLNTLSIHTPGTSAVPGRALRCKAVQWLDESVPPSLCVSEIRIHAYR